MTMTTAQSVQQLYVAYFGRPAEPDGLTYWVSALANGATLNDISNAFSQTTEYKASFAGMSNDAIVTQIYQNLFNRAPDPSGLAFWSGHLLDGSLSVSHIVDDISSSAVNNPNVSGTDTAAIVDKIAAATAFTDLLNANPALRAAYSTPAAGQIAKDFLHGVSDDASLDTAKSALPTSVTDALIGKPPTAPDTPSQPAVVKALTTGQDTLVGTGGNDTFNSAATDGNEHAVTTLTAGDSIDGGAGTDTFNLVATETTNNHLVGTVKNVETINITGSDFIDVDGISGRGTIAADFFVGARTIAVDGAFTDINNVAAGEKVAFAAHGIHDSVNYLDGVTSAAIGLTGVSGAITVSGAALTTLTVSGSTNTQIFDLSRTLVAETDPHLLRLIDAGDSVTTLNLALTNNSTVDVSGMAALTTLNASHSTGAIDLFDDLSSNLASITTGSGSDQIDIAGTDGALIVSTGAGNDVINLNDALPGGVIIDGGDGNDTVNLNISGEGTALSGEVIHVETINITGSDNAAGGINASLFAGPTTVTVDGVLTDVTHVAANEKIAFTAHGIDSSIAYSSDVASATIGLTNASGSLSVNGEALTTLTVTGSTYVPPVLQLLVANDAPPTLTLDGGDSPIATLNLNLSTDTSVDVSGLGALVSVDASTSSGGIDFLGTLGNTVTTVLTGSGNDFVNLDTQFTAHATHASVSTGAGDDQIHIDVDSGAHAGTFAVDAGAGNDVVFLASALATGDTIDGGTGLDTVVLTQASGILDNSAATLISTAISHVETLEFSLGVTVDQSHLAQFANLVFDEASVLTGVTQTEQQTLLAHGNLEASADGYVAADGANAAIYAGAIDVTTDGGQLIVVNANTATVNVNASLSGDLATSITGDLHAGLTVNVNNAPDSSDAASASITVNTEHVSTGTGDADVAASLASLTSITLTGSGAVTLDNSNTIGGGAATALTNIDATQLGGIHAQTGAVTEGLTFTGNLNVAENIALGTGTDHITVASTVAVLDTITGFDAVKETADNTSTVDTLDFAGLHIDGGSAALSQSAIVTVVTPGAVLADYFSAAASASFSQAANGVGAIETFTFDGATYLYQNLGADDGSHATDLAVKLVGTIDFTQAYGIHQLPA